MMISMKVGLEREQEKLLTVNVELALETKRLLEQQKEWEEQEKVRSSFLEPQRMGIHHLPCILSLFFEDARGINKQNDIHPFPPQGLIRANEEFVAEVTISQCF